MHYKYKFLLVEVGEERVYYDLTAEGIYEVMQNPDMILSCVDKVDKVE